MFQDVVFWAGAGRSCQVGSENGWCFELWGLWISQIPWGKNPARITGISLGTQTLGSTTTAIVEMAREGTGETSTTTLPQALILQGANTYFRLLSAKFWLSPYWEAAFWNSSMATGASTFCSIRNFGTGLFGYKPDTEFTLEKIQNANNCNTRLTLGKQLHLQLWQVPVSDSVVLGQSWHHQLTATLPHWWGYSWDWSIYSDINCRSFCGIYSK